MLRLGIDFLVIIFLVASLDAVRGFQSFSPRPTFTKSESSGTTYRYTRHTPSTRQFLAAGKGGFGGGSTKQNKDSSKLKPKQQWDRYLSFKKERAIPVGVRVDENWLEVGSIKSKDDATPVEVTVTRQRALIAEHAKRLFPLQVTPTAKLAWGYRENEEWRIVDKVTVPDGIEKLIGFEGLGDPATGFYCVYNEGRRVNGAGDALKPNSTKAANRK